MNCPPAAPAKTSLAGAAGGQRLPSVICPLRREAPMKCVSVSQPWAWAILAGLQEIEYRCYPTDYRGDLLIHASSEVNDWSRRQLALFGRRAPDWEELPFGRVIGLVELWDCEQGSDGIWSWHLRHPRFVKPFRF